MTEITCDPKKNSSQYFSTKMSKVGSNNMLDKACVLLKSYRKNYLVALSLILLYPTKYATLTVQYQKKKQKSSLGTAQNTLHSELAYQAGFSTLNSLLQTLFRSRKKSSDANYSIFVPYFSGKVTLHPKCQTTFASFSVLLKFSK